MAPTGLPVPSMPCPDGCGREMRVVHILTEASVIGVSLPSQVLLQCDQCKRIDTANVTLRRNADKTFEYVVVPG